MDLTLVKNRRGKRVICWGAFLKILIVLMIIPAAFSSGVYYLATKRWDNIALYGGLAAGALTAIITLIVALCTPIFKLPFDNEGNKNQP